MSNTRNLIYELPFELPRDLKLRTLVNKEILAKSENCMGTQPNAQPFLQKQIFGTCTQIVRKNISKIFYLVYIFVIT